MGGHPNISNFSFVDAQPTSGLVPAKICYFIQTRVFGPLFWRMASQEFSARVESSHSPSLTKSQPFRGSGHLSTSRQDLALCRAAVWCCFPEFREILGRHRHQSGGPPRQPCRTVASVVSGSGETAGIDETHSSDRLIQQHCLPQRNSPPASPPHCGNLIQGQTLLVERVTTVCPVCGAPAHTVCHLCGDKFCHAHLYVCLDCNTAFCGGCMDLHEAEGHWGDSDTAREMFSSITGGER